MIRVAARELVTVVERVLVRAGYQHGLALAAAELLTLGEAARPGHAQLLSELLPRLDGLAAAEPPVIRTSLGATEVDARGALGLVIGPTLVDLLELHAASSDSMVVVSGAVGGPLLGAVAPAARERGLVVTVETEDDGATCTVTGRCAPAASASQLASYIELALPVWQALVEQANLVLAPATAESRLDAGY
jgi:hypothetical protein